MKALMIPALTVLVGVLLAAPVAAVDGVFEINQTCAVNTGCFAGDTAGFPVTIGSSGSYRLTGNLTLPDTNTTGVSIATDDVALDLNGFAVIGVVTCFVDFGNNTVTCSGSGSGDAIIGQSGADNIVIRNGTVRGAGRWGIVLQSAVGSLVDRVVATQNGGGNAGIDILGNVTNCISSLNKQGGIRIQAGTATGNHIRDNGSHGILGGSGVISGNHVHANFGDGIRARGTVTANEIGNNAGDGISLSGTSIALGNVSEGNTGVGLRFTGSGMYEQNVIDGNTGGTVVGGIEPDPGLSNFCNGNTTCP